MCQVVEKSLQVLLFVPAGEICRAYYFDNHEKSLPRLKVGGGAHILTKTEKNQSKPQFQVEFPCLHTVEPANK